MRSLGSGYGRLRVGERRVRWRGAEGLGKKRSGMMEGFSVTREGGRWRGGAIVHMDAISICTGLARPKLKPKGLSTQHASSLCTHHFGLRNRTPTPTPPRGCNVTNYVIFYKCYL